MNFWQFATGYLIASLVFGSFVLCRLGQLASKHDGPGPVTRGIWVDTSIFASVYLFWPIALVLLIAFEGLLWLIGEHHA